MIRPVRMVLVVLLAVFAVGTVVHAANATIMSVKMASAAAGGMQDGGCDECPSGDGKASVCAGMCVQPLWATAANGETLSSIIKGVFSGVYSSPIETRAGPPDPYPPRFLILS